KLFTQFIKPETTRFTDSTFANDPRFKKIRKKIANDRKAERHRDRYGADVENVLKDARDENGRWFGEKKINDFMQNSRDVSISNPNIIIQDNSHMTYNIPGPFCDASQFTSLNSRCSRSTNLPHARSLESSHQRESESIASASNSAIIGKLKSYKK